MLMCRDRDRELILCDEFDESSQSSYELLMKVVEVDEDAELMKIKKM